MSRSMDLASSPAPGPPHGLSRRLWRLLVRHRPGLDLLVLGICAAAFLAHCLEYRIVQDDAYISFVYSKNLALGNGLVFNLGERVEGYTNFLWTMIHVVPHLIDVDAVATSQILGFLSALGLLAATWLVGRQLRPHRPALAHTPALVLLAANGALAFWTLSGMETLLFALLVTLGAWSYLGELRTGGPVWRTGWIFGLAALTRPEGLLFFGLTGLHRLILQLLDRRLDVRAHVPSVVPFLILVAPHFIFRLSYYGYPLPNTFYAKTGLGLEYLTDGLGYTLKFLVDYGFWGLGLVAPIVLMLWQRQRRQHAYLGLLIWANALYVSAAGGDTMAENRLFLPVLALVYVALQELGHRLTHCAGAWLHDRGFGAARLRPELALALLLFAAAGHYTFHHARSNVLHAQRATRAHNDKLHDLAAFVRTLAGSDELLLSSTAIGIPRYYTAASVLDLVGLTDETVAHRPHPLPGISTTHRLRNYNVQYVMDRAPDFIFFITGERPATPAEKALFLSRRFRQDYRLGYLADDRPIYIRRFARPLPEDVLHPSAEFAELYARGLAAAPHDSSMALFRAAIERAPADFAHAHAWLGRELYDRLQIREAAEVLTQAVGRDSTCVSAHAHLAIISVVGDRADKALALSRRAAELAPLSHFSRYAHGRALLAAGHTSEGVAELLQALELDGAAPSAPDAWYRIGVAHLRLGEMRRARAAWEAVLRLGPDHDGALDGIRMLDSRGL